MTTPHGGPPRRRGRALEEAIYQAVFDQMAEVGYAGFSMDGVATAARTGKAPLYRRWPDKDALLLAALSDRLPDASRIPFTGDLRDDLIAVLRFLKQACAVSADPGLQAIKQHADPAHALVRERVSDPIRRLTLGILEAAEARGEVRPGAATELIARVGPAMLIHQNLTEPGGLDDAFVVSVVDDVLLPMVRATPAGDRNLSTAAPTGR